MTETEHLENLKRLKDAICTLGCPNIIGIIREYNAAVNDFRRWGKVNPTSVTQDKKAEANPVIHKFEFTENGIRFVD